MANLNLSEFTEKLFVADADHTFIWDSAVSISKRVSRNSWLSGTNSNCRLGLADAASPVAQTLSVQSVVAGTTNTAGAAFTIDGSQGTGTGAGGALIFRTAAAGSSGTAQNALATAMLITADKRVVPTGLTIDGSGLFEIFNDLATAQGRTFPARSASIGRLGICYRADAQIAWSPGNGSTVDGGNMGTADTILLRDGAANTLALRNGGAPQTFRVYNTYTDASNYERLDIGWTSNTLFIRNVKTGSGQNRDLVVTSGADMYLGSGNTDRWRIVNSGHFIGNVDNQYDIGASGANRPRNVYVGSDVHASVLRAGIWVLNPSGVVHGTIRSESDGVFRLTDSAINNFNRLQFGNTSASFPAIKRVGAEFQVVIASTTAAINVAAPDADLTFIEDRYRRKGAGSPEGVVTAPIGAVYHNTIGAAGTSFYVKESGTGNTGWVGK